MKVGGKRLATRNSQKVVLTRGEDKIELTVTALPPGWDSRIHAIGLLDDRPTPPRVPKQEKGLYVKKANGIIEYEDNIRDPGYRAAVLKYNARLDALQLAEMLALDPTVEFETTKPTSTSLAEWQAYADGLISELEDQESGFTSAEIDQILAVGRKLEGSIDVEAGAGHFLSQ